MCLHYVHNFENSADNSTIPSCSKSEPMRDECLQAYSTSLSHQKRKVRMLKAGFALQSQHDMHVRKNFPSELAVHFT